MEVVFLSLGSNLADRRQALIHAIREISLLPETEVGRISSVYRTQPVGFEAQPYFLNLALEIKTKLSPTCLLLALQAIESKSGRIRSERWGPRLIDIDIISYGTLVQNNAFLKLPHPRMAERNFVLIPLNEIAENYIVPQYNQTVAQILAKTSDKSWVEPETGIELSLILK